MLVVAGAPEDGRWVPLTCVGPAEGDRRRADAAGGDRRSDGETRTLVGGAGCASIAIDGGQWRGAVPGPTPDAAPTASEIATVEEACAEAVFPERLQEARLVVWQSGDVGTDDEVRIAPPHRHDLLPGERSELRRIIGALHPPAGPPFEVRQVFTLGGRGGDVGTSREARIFVVRAARLTPGEGRRPDGTSPTVDAVLIRRAPENDTSDAASPSQVLPLYALDGELEVRAVGDLDADGTEEMIVWQRPRGDGPRLVVEALIGGSLRRVAVLRCPESAVESGN